MSSTAQTSRVLPFEQARRVVEEHARTVSRPSVETVDLLHAHHRILAEDLHADRDFPPFPRSARDGFAVQANDLRNVPARLRVTGEVQAGTPVGQHSVTSGTAVEIMTGAPVPEGADAVVMVEYTRRDVEFVVIERGVKSGDNVVSRGSEARAGQLLLPAGTRMRFAQFAVAAAIGRTQARVCARPRVAILSTGDEIVDIAAQPEPHQIRNSNTFSLWAQIAETGGEPVPLPVAPDDESVLHHLIEQGLTSDLLLMTGGVSMGKYDLVEKVLAEFHAEFFFTGALIQPGRPIVFGLVPNAGGVGTYFFGLPGNPVSTMVTFDVFVRPMLDALSGRTPEPLRFLHAKLAREIRTKTGLTRFLPARLTGELADTSIELVSWQGSGDIAAAARADCYIVVPPDREQIAAGEMVMIFPR